MIFVPIISDLKGRKIVYVVSLLATLIALTGEYFTKSIKWAYVFQLLLGMTFSGRNIVGRLLYIEFTNQSNLDRIMQAIFFIDPFSYFLQALYYQTISNSIYPLEMFILVVGIMIFIFTVFYMPESPKFFYNKERYQEARESLRFAAKFNDIQEN